MEFVSYENDYIAGSSFVVPSSTVRCKAVAATYAERFAERTLGFVRYQGGGQLSGDLRIVTKMPVLYFDTSTLVSPQFESGRRGGAPWSSVKENVDHMVLSDNGAEFMIAWIRGVISERLGTDGTLLPTADNDRTWLGNYETADIAPFSSYSGVKSSGIWLPDEASAREWQKLMKR